MRRTLDLVFAHVNHHWRVNCCNIQSEYSHSYEYDTVLTCGSEKENHIESRLGSVGCNRARFSGPDRSRFTLIAMWIFRQPPVNRSDRHVTSRGNSLVSFQKELLTPSLTSA